MPHQILSYKISVHSEEKMGFPRYTVRINGLFAACFLSEEKAETEKRKIIETFNSLSDSERQRQYIQKLIEKNSMYQ